MGLRQPDEVLRLAKLARGLVVVLVSDDHWNRDFR
jgi:hypothetical protein